MGDGNLGRIDASRLDVPGAFVPVGSWSTESPETSVSLFRLHRGHSAALTPAQAGYDGVITIFRGTFHLFHVIHMATGLCQPVGDIVWIVADDCGYPGL